MTHKGLPVMHKLQPAPPETPRPQPTPTSTLWADPESAGDRDVEQRHGASTELTRSRFGQRFINPSWLPENPWKLVTASTVPHLGNPIHWSWARPEGLSSANSPASSNVGMCLDSPRLTQERMESPPSILQNAESHNPSEIFRKEYGIH